MSMPPVSMLSERDVLRAEAERLCARAVGREDVRQLELKVGVHPADRGSAWSRWMSAALRPISIRLGPVTTNWSGSVRWPGNTPNGRGNARTPATCASSRRRASSTCCCERIPCARRSAFGSMRMTSVAWLTCCALPRPMMPHSVTISG
jgi:hypothetical protein